MGRGRGERREERDRRVRDQNRYENKIFGIINVCMYLNKLLLKIYEFALQKLRSNKIGIFIASFLTINTNPYYIPHPIIISCNLAARTC